MTVKQILATDYGRLGYMFGARQLADAREFGDNPSNAYIVELAWEESESAPDDFAQRAFADGADIGAMDLRTRNRNAAARKRLEKYA